MENLVKSELFSLLVKNSQEVSNNEMENAYGDFMKQIKSFIQSETDSLEIFRALSFTRIEFKISQAQILYEQEKKCA